MKKLILLFCFLVLQAATVNAQGTKKNENKTLVPNKRKDIVKTTQRCQIEGDYANNFIAYIWKMEACCSPTATMCKFLGRGVELHQLLFDKLEKAQSIYNPTLHSSNRNWPVNVAKQRICPDQHTRAVWDGGSHLLQYRPYSTLEVDGSALKDNPDLWLARFCDFDAEWLFKGANSDPAVINDVMAQAANPDQAGAVTGPAQAANPDQAGAVAGSAAQPEQIPTQPARPRLITAQKAPEGARQIFDIFFYAVPTPGNLSTVRHFRTADKQQELKINFSSGNKSKFLQKLGKQFPKESSKITHCKNKNILFETQQNVYQVFILAPSAVTVLARPNGFPADESTQKQLCDFNALLFW